jgi:antitoxin component YwqK of YwqJK toxin-antitoxin module
MKNILKVKEGDKAAAFGPPEDFSGEFQICFKSGKLAYCGQYRDGKRNGQQCSYWDDGKLSIVGYAKNDVAIGTWLHFMEGGMLMYEERFTEREGTYSKRWFDALGRVERTVYYRDGVEVESSEAEKENK